MSKKSLTDAGRGKLLAAAFIIVITCFLVYTPAINGGFVWDDEHYITGNELLWAPDGIWRIWFTTDSPSQYFPLTYTTFRFEYALWKFNPAGYHVVNIILHAANSLLVWLVLRRLKIPGAWFAAMIFTLHPVHVESVAWITERKNLLMLLFSLLSLLAWLKFIDADLQSRRSRHFYLLSLLLYALALAGKTTACTLPAALVLVLWLKNQPLNLKRWLQIAPYIFLGLAAGALVIWWEMHHQRTEFAKFDLGLIDRLLIASRALWFYIGKLLCPTNLAFSYTKWKIDPANPLQYTALVACVTAAFCLWHWRKKIGRGTIAAVVFFVAALSPVIGFISLYTFVYSYVADHYQYFASIGPIALIAAIGYSITEKLNRSGKFLAVTVAGIVLLALGTLSWRQCNIYRDVETLYCDTIRKNPDSILANNNLGTILLDRGRIDDAIKLFQKAADAMPQLTSAASNLAVAYRKQGRIDDAIEQLYKVLQFDPDECQAHHRLGQLLESKGINDQALKHYRRSVEIKPDVALYNYYLGNFLASQGETTEAIDIFNRVLNLDPNYMPAVPQLAFILAANPDPNIRDPNRALELALHADRLTADRDINALAALAAAYAANNHFDIAVRTAEKAIVLARSSRQNELADEIQTHLNCYKTGKPYFEPVP